MIEFFDYAVIFEDGTVRFFETYADAWVFTTNFSHERLRIYTCTDVLDAVLEEDI